MMLCSTQESDPRARMLEEIQELEARKRQLQAEVGGLGGEPVTPPNQPQARASTSSTAPSTPLSASTECSSSPGPKQEKAPRKHLAVQCN